MELSGHEVEGLNSYDQAQHHVMKLLVSGARGLGTIL